jgi:hypothetical protein
MRRIGQVARMGWGEILKIMLVWIPQGSRPFQRHAALKRSLQIHKVTVPIHMAQIRLLRAPQWNLRFHKQQVISRQAERLSASLGRLQQAVAHCLKKTRNIKMNLTNTQGYSADSYGPDPATASTAVKPSVPQIAGNFQTSWATLSFSRTTAACSCPLFEDDTEQVQAEAVCVLEVPGRVFAMYLIISMVTPSWHLALGDYGFLHIHSAFIN